ncbi:MAG TPA: hypothetical protein VNF24_04805 [Candidatus Acidoferrales bacterium]|nr:hypothetical protein [Candidatus Acidoferrales bacterium]
MSAFIRLTISAFVILADFSLLATTGAPSRLPGEHAETATPAWKCS